MRPNGASIKALRKALKWSLRDLQDLTGLDRGYLSRIERSHIRSVATWRILRIAAALEVPTAAITHDIRGEDVTAPRAKKPPVKKRTVPAPSSAEGELYHYTPLEAAEWLPFSGRKLQEMAYLRQIPHVNNGNKIWFSGLNIRAISEQFTVTPLSETRATKRPAA